MKLVDVRKMCVGGGMTVREGREELALELELENENCVGVRFRGDISGIVGSKGVLDVDDRRGARGGTGGVGKEKLLNTIPDLDEGWLKDSSGLAGLGGGVFVDTGGLACGVTGGGRSGLAKGGESC